MMRKTWILAVVILLSGIALEALDKSDWPVLRGPFLGQKSPGDVSKIFLDGPICTRGNPQMCAGFTPDGKEFYFNAMKSGNWTIYYTRELNGKWTQPEPVSFTSDFTDRDFTLSPDGRRIFFGSNRPKTGELKPQKSLDIFVSHRGANQVWGPPANLGTPVNTDFGENYPSVAKNGNLYFFSCRNEGQGGCEIYLSRYLNEQYNQPVNLGPSINSGKNDWDSFIAPDESYIIFSSQNRDDTLGGQDLYISWRTGKGSWSKARNMGAAVNSSSGEICPSVTPDGKYLFFTSRRRGRADIYWINSTIINELKPDGK